MDVERGEGGGTGSARRRRERRLRSMLRHERMAVAMALAEALHHSSGLRVMERAQHAAPRGQETGTRAGEEVEHVTHSGPRAPKTPPPGARPGLPPEPVPQRSDRSLRRFAGDALPQLATPSLAGAAGEAVDGAALAFLLSQSLAAKQHEEQKKREEEAKKAHRAWWRRRQKVLDEFMALLGRPSRTPLEQERMREVGDLLDAMDDAGPPPSSASSSSVRRKKKKRRRR